MRVHTVILCLLVLGPIAKPVAAASDGAATAVLAFELALDALDVDASLHDAGAARRRGDAGMTQDVAQSVVDAAKRALSLSSAEEGHLAQIAFAELLLTRTEGCPSRERLQVIGQLLGTFPTSTSGAMAYAESLVNGYPAEGSPRSTTNLRVVLTALIGSTPKSGEDKLEGWLAKLYLNAPPPLASAIYNSNQTGVINQHIDWATPATWEVAARVLAVEDASVKQDEEIRRELALLRRDVYVRIAQLDRSIDARIRAVVAEAVSRVHDRLDELYEQVADLESRVDRVEVVQQMLLERELPGLASPVPELADGEFRDEDADGIDDRIERHLIRQYAPAIVIDRPFDLPAEERVGVPCDPLWFAKNATVELVSETLGDLDPRLRTTDPARAQIPSPAYAAVRDALGMGDQNSIAAPVDTILSIPRDHHRLIRLTLKRQPNLWWTGEHGGFEAAAKSGDGIFARVWRPFPRYPHLLSVQYYVYLTWNESTTYKNPLIKDQRAGSHEGDWLCFDFCINVADPLLPHLAHAVIHNHGRQIFCLPEALEYVKLPGGKKSHPVVYLEWGSNEPWPNAGLGGEGGWPRRDGIGVNERFLVEADLVLGTKKISDETQVVSSHAGQGFAWRTWWRDIPNLGELSEGVPVPDKWDADTEGLYAESRRFVLLFGGLYGSVKTDLELLASIYNIRETDNPVGPTAKMKFWERRWTDRGGPWHGSGDPHDERSWDLETRDGYRFTR